MKKKTETGESGQMTIDEIAELYRKYDSEAKKAAEQSEKYKKQLIKYAKANTNLFVKNTLSFANGLCIDKRNTPKIEFDPEAVTVDWLAKMCEADYGDLINVDLDKKIIDKATKDKTLNTYLSEISYCTNTKESFVVRTK